MAIIYVIDDHELMRDAMATVFRRLQLGMRVMELKCLAEFKACTDDMPPTPGSVVFLDLNLPDAEGCSGVRFVSQCFPALPIAVCSALPATDVERDCLDAGAHLYVEKTVDSRQLMTALRRLFRSGIGLDKDHAPASS